MDWDGIIYIDPGVGSVPSIQLGQQLVPEMPALRIFIPEPMFTDCCSNQIKLYLSTEFAVTIIGLDNAVKLMLTTADIGFKVCVVN